MPKIKTITTWVGWEEKRIWPNIEYDIDITNFKTTASYSWVSWAWAWTFSKDWKNFFVSQNNGNINQYVLSTPYNFNTVTDTKTVSSSWQIHQVYISPDGLHLAYASYSSFVWIWDLTTPNDVSTATNHKTRWCSYPVWIWFKPDWTRFYVWFYSNSWIQQYDLSTPWDITTLTGTGGLGTWTERWVTLSKDGTILIRCDSSNGSAHTLYQYTLSTPRDITTATQTKTASVSGAMYSLTHDDSRLNEATNWVWEFYEK